MALSELISQLDFSTIKDDFIRRDPQTGHYYFTEKFGRYFISMEFSQNPKDRSKRPKIKFRRSLPNDLEEVTPFEYVRDDYFKRFLALPQARIPSLVEIGVNNGLIYHFLNNVSFEAGLPKGNIYSIFEDLELKTFSPDFTREVFSQRSLVPFTSSILSMNCLHLRVFQGRDAIGQKFEEDPNLESPMREYERELDEYFRLF